MTKISINQKECIGCSFCMSCNPKLFKFDEADCKGKLNQNGSLADSAYFELSPEDLMRVKEAAEGCPAQAISVAEN